MTKLHYFISGTWLKLVLPIFYSFTEQMYESNSNENSCIKCLYSIYIFFFTLLNTYPPAVHQCHDAIAVTWPVLLCTLFLSVQKWIWLSASFKGPNRWLLCVARSGEYYRCRRICEQWLLQLYLWGYWSVLSCCKWLHFFQVTSLRLYFTNLWYVSLFIVDPFCEKYVAVIFFMSHKTANMTIPADGAIQNFLLFG